MASKELRLWLSDQCLSILGLSEPTVMDYILATASKAPSPQALHASLLAIIDLPPSTPMETFKSFVLNLYSRIPKRTKTPSSTSNAAKKLPDKKYSLVQFDDDEENIESRTTKMTLKDTSIKADSKIPRKSSKSSRRHRTKKDASSSSSSEDEANGNHHNKAPSLLESKEEEDEYTQKERERELDIKERNEFAERLKERDKEKTKKVSLFFSLIA